MACCASARWSRTESIERSPSVAAGWPQLVAMERCVANIRVRSTGTLGGNLAFADPHSDPATFLLAADASVILGRGDERRRLPLGAFVLGPYATALEPGELLVAIEVPSAARRERAWRTCASRSTSAPP